MKKSSKVVQPLGTTPLLIIVAFLLVFLMEKSSIVVRHLGIAFLLLAAGFLLMTPPIYPEQKWIGWVALLWAFAIARDALGKEGYMKKVEETDWYQKYHK